MYESWTASIHQIAAIDDSLHIVELRQQFDAQWAGGASGYRYYAENFLEALDTPGEFYFDRYGVKDMKATVAETLPFICCVDFQRVPRPELHSTGRCQSPASHCHCPTGPCLFVSGGFALL